MKTSLLVCALLFATLQNSRAGGNTSIVELHKVSSIKIEDERIVIVGNGMIRKRVLSDAEQVMAAPLVNLFNGSTPK